MFVKDYMTRHPIMIAPDTRVIEAQKLMGENNIRHLPIVGDGKRILGLVTREAAIRLKTARLLYRKVVIAVSHNDFLQFDILGNYFIGDIA